MQVICKQEFQSKPCPQALLVCCTVLVCKGLHTPGLFKTDAIPQDVTESLAALLGGGEETIAGLLYILIRTAHRPLQAFHVFLSEQATDHYRAFMYPYQNRPQTISGLSCIPIRTGLMYLYQNRPQDHFCQPSQTLTRLHRCMPQHTRISCIRARCAPSSGSTPFSMAMLCRGKGNNLLIDRWSCLSGLFDYPVLVPRPSLLTLNATIGRCGDLCTTGRCGDLCTSRELCFGAKRNGPCDGSGYYQAHPGVLGRAPSD